MFFTVPGSMKLLLCREKGQPEGNQKATKSSERLIKSKGMVS
jgi:hypothetical protein